MTRTRWRKMLIILLTVALLICISGVWFLAGTGGDPRLSVTYAGAVDGKGHWELRFAITNIGDTTVFTSSLGNIEIANQTNAFTVGASAPLSQLAPGQGQIVEAVLSETQMQSVRSKWRYKCLYARDGVRARIYRWQWGPNGPGPRVNWLIPQKLKGIPLDVVGSTDWIIPQK